MYGSPLGKDWRKKVEEVKPLEKFKKEKSIISTKAGKELLGHSCSSQELFWLDGWLDNLVRSRSLPPSCKGKDAFNALTQILSPQDALQVLDGVRRDFLMSHPKQSALTEDFGFLLSEMAAYS